MEQEIIQYTKEVWSSILGMEAEHAESFNPSEIEKTLLGFVQITGAWNGTLSIHCSASMARKAAAVMFDLKEESTTMEEIQDALGELANMVGGNVKGLLPDDDVCLLSLPAVAITDYPLYIPDSVEVARVNFSCGDNDFVVTLQKRGK